MREKKTVLGCRKEFFELDEAKLKNTLDKYDIILHTDERKSDDIRNIHECARKVVLMWNYLPVIVKAFIQTKRRTLNLDKNSKKFE